MSIQKAIQNIRQKNLDEMRNNLQSALTEKAVQKLEEKKVVIAQNYFGKSK